MVSDIERNLTTYLMGIKEGDKLFHLSEGVRRNGHIEWNVCIATLIEVVSEDSITWRDADPERWKDLHESWFPHAFEKRLRRFEFERGLSSRIEWQLTLKYEPKEEAIEKIRKEMEQYVPLLQKFAFLLIDAEIERRRDET